MRGTGRGGVWAGAVRRTSVALLLGLLAALSHAQGPAAPGEGLVLGDAAGGGLGELLEASMTSSLLSQLRDAAVGVGTAEAGTAQAPGFPESSAAVVGRVFQMRVPSAMEDGSDAGSTVKFSESGKDALPGWLHWDPEIHTLLGLPMEEDKGVTFISVSRPGQEDQEVFSIEVHPEEHADTAADPAQPALHASEDDVPPFACSNEEPVTVLTVILDADLTKMTSRQRVALLASMRDFSGVGLRHMKILPVVNNRLFDMSAFMAGPGNAKKVVENGALLSWKLGCALDQRTVPGIARVQAPAKEGSMSARLGYPVVGWHIANKKPHVPKRVRRSLSNTPTPVLTVLPPTTLVVPPVRVVPTLSSPSIAAPTASSAPPVREPMPLPGRPDTVRVHGPTSHTPTLGPVLPTRVVDTSSTVSIQPTMTRPSIVEPTATPPTPTTRRPTTKKPKPTRRPKTTPAPKEPKTTTARPARRTTPAPVLPDPKNTKPVLRNPIDEVNAWVDTYFEMKIPSDTFFDTEDGATDKLRLTLRKNANEVVGDDSWIQFNSTSQLLYGLPDAGGVGKHEYFMQATDKDGLNAIDAFEVRVHKGPASDKSPVLFTARLQGEPRSVTHNIHKKILLIKKLAASLGDRNASTITLRNITKGSIVVDFTNNSLPQSPCPREVITKLSQRLADAQGRPTSSFSYVMGPDFKPLGVTIKGTGACRNYMFVPPGEHPVVSEAPPVVTPGLGSSRQSTDDVYLHTVIPAVVVAAILLIAGIIAMICYRKKRKGKLTIEDQATFIKKGVPIIFADELDDSKPPPSSSMPLILQEEKPPLPPPEYPNMGSPETTPLNQDLLGEYTALRDEDPNAPPYQPPPPFTTPMEGKGSRPKNMTPYRSPPPYVPP